MKCLIVNLHSAFEPLSLELGHVSTSNGWGIYAWPCAVTKFRPPQASIDKSHQFDIQNMKCAHAKANYQL